MILKTLKDIDDGIKIRQEAIKWIKEFTKEILKHSHQDKINPPYFDCLMCRNKYVQMQWIKHFFNITEEELK